MLVYYAFDLLHLDGEPLACRALEHRKNTLCELLRRANTNAVIRYVEHFTAPGPNVFAQACKLGLEGIVSKRRDLPYHAGRSTSWLKAKCRLRHEFIVGGFTAGEGARQGIGALLLGHYDAQGRLIYCGKVGNGPGFTAAYTTQLRREFDVLEQLDCPFRPRPPGALGRQAHWVRPERVAEVSFTEWTEGGTVRHPLLEGFRRDKQPDDVRLERAVAPDVIAAAEPTRSEPRQPALASTRARVSGRSMRRRRPRKAGRK